MSARRRNGALRRARTREERARRERALAAISALHVRRAAHVRHLQFTNAARPVR